MNAIMKAGFLGILLLGNMSYASEHNNELPHGNVHIELHDVKTKENKDDGSLNTIAVVSKEDQAQATRESKEDAEDFPSMCEEWPRWSSAERRCTISCLMLTAVIAVGLGTWPLWFEPLFPEVKEGKHLSAILNYQPDQESTGLDACVQVNVKQFDGLAQTTCVSNSTDISQISQNINAICLGASCRVTAIARVQCNDDARTRRCDSRLLKVAKNRNSVQSHGRKQNRR